MKDFQQLLLTIEQVHQNLQVYPQILGQCPKKSKRLWFLSVPAIRASVSPESPGKLNVLKPKPETFET